MNKNTLFAKKETTKPRAVAEPVSSPMVPTQQHEGVPGLKRKKRKRKKVAKTDERVLFLTSYATAYSSFNEGEVHKVNIPFAKELIKQGVAILV